MAERGRTLLDDTAFDVLADEQGVAHVFEARDGYFRRAPCGLLWTARLRDVDGERDELDPTCGAFLVQVAIRRAEVPA